MSNQKQLTIKLDIKNESNKTIERPHIYRITFLNDALEKANGSNSITIESKDIRSLHPGKSADVTKQLILQQAVTKKDLIIQVEAISDSKTLNSFVIESIDYEESDFPFIQHIQIDKRDGKFFANGVTLEKSIEEAFSTLNHELDGNLPNEFSYFPIGKSYTDPNFQDDHMTLNYSKNGTVNYGISIVKSDALLQYIYDLGEPYHKSETGIDWYYEKDTNQLLSISETDEGNLV